MSAPHADQLIEGYLARLNDQASDLPKSTRRELTDDMRSHIAEARAREPEETDASILNILDRLGEPSIVVADARERLGLKGAAPVPRRPAGSSRGDPGPIPVAGWRDSPLDVAGLALA